MTMARYYDIILALIPASLIGVTTILTVAGLSAITAVPLGAVVALVLIGHALFVNSPRDEHDHRPANSQTTSQQPPLNAD